MQCVIPASYLAELLKAVEPATAKRTAKPILANVLLKVDAEGLTATATDMETTIVSTVRAVDVKTAGSVVADPVKLRQIADSTKGDVKLDLDGDTLHVKTDTGRFKLATWPAAEFPEADLPDAFVDVKGLGGALKSVSFAADKKESGARWAVTGTLFDVKAQALSVVATDTKRMAMTPAGTLPEDGEYIIPRGVCDLIARVGGDVGVAMAKNQAAFRLSDGTMILTRLVEGKFPPYRDIIPKKFGVELDLPVAQFAAAIRQAAIMTAAETKRVQFEFAPGGITLSATGEGESEVRIDMPECTAEVSIAFDPAYLLEGLRAIEGQETVKLSMTNGGKPVVFSAGEWRYLVMPLAHN
jgi:DNA polymerase III subunit beta